MSSHWDLKMDLICVWLGQLEGRRGLTFEQRGNLVKGLSRVVACMSLGGEHRRLLQGCVKNC